MPLGNAQGVAAWLGLALTANGPARSLSCCPAPATRADQPSTGMPPIRSVRLALRSAGGAVYFWRLFVSSPRFTCAVVTAKAPTTKTDHFTEPSDQRDPIVPRSMDYLPKYTSLPTVDTKMPFHTCFSLSTSAPVRGFSGRERESKIV